MVRTNPNCRGPYKNHSTSFGGNDRDFIEHGPVSRLQNVCGVECVLSLVPIYIGRRVYINRCLKFSPFCDKSSIRATPLTTIEAMRSKSKEINDA